MAFDENLSPNQKKWPTAPDSWVFRCILWEPQVITQVISPDVYTPASVWIIIIRRPYWVPEAQSHAIEEEVQKMRKLGVIEESYSPIVMVPMPNGTFWFCNDFRELNEVSTFDGYPMSHGGELIDRLGKARFISTLNLTKGYWHVPHTPSAWEKSTFSTTSG